MKKVRITTKLFNTWITTGYNNLEDDSYYRITKGIDKDDILVHVELSYDKKEILLWYDKEEPKELMIEAQRLKKYKLKYEAEWNSTQQT